jgi:hypothetical protein
MSVQCLLLRVPASLASDSLVMPVFFVFLLWLCLWHACEERRPHAREKPLESSAPHHQHQSANTQHPQQPHNIIIISSRHRTGQAAALGAVALLELLLVLEVGERQDAVDDAALGDALEQRRRQLALAAKAQDLGRQGLLGLRVERRVLDVARDEEPQVVLDHERLDVGALVLLVDALDQEPWIFVLGVVVLFVV